METIPTEQESTRLKELVREKYSQIAKQELAVNASSCCGATPTSKEVYNIMMDDYSQLDGYAQEADLGLGCGLPTAFAHIRPGDIVIDLGSGAGNDCFVARHETGPEGKVIGIDFTPAMVAKSRENAFKLGYNNVEFIQGDIDDMPLPANIADVVVSNCVLNLVPNKAAVMDEMFRVLKPGGHFSVSDVVLVGHLPEALRNDATMYAGCVAGAMQESAYLEALHTAGFTEVMVQKRKTITIPRDILTKYLELDGIDAFESGSTGIFSITVFGKKPGNTPRGVKVKVKLNELQNCQPNTGCC